MENQNKSRSVVHGFVKVIKHTQDDTVNGMKEAVKKATVLQKKVTQVLIYSKNAVSVLDINELERHLGSPVHGIFITTGRTETAVASERDKFEITTVGTAKHGATKRGIAAMDHFLDIFELAFTWVKGIFNFVIIIIENFL